MVQKSLFVNGGKESALLPSVDISLIDISPLNPRKTWDEKHIQDLAQAIEDNGFDGTRAVKCYKEGDRFKCFAGSHRLKACKMIGRTEIPVYLYTGYTDEEVWKMAYDDNEDAGKQQQFSVVDVWEDYADKQRRFNWTVRDMKVFLNLKTISIVSERITFSGLNDNIKSAFRLNGLKESHARELIKCSKLEHFDVLNEVLSNVLKNKNKPQAKDFAKEVEKYNKIVETINEWSAQLEGEYLEQFNEFVKDNRVPAMIANKGKLLKDDQDAKQEEDLQMLLHGDSREMVAQMPDGVKLLFTDPPYGMDYQSNRPTATAKKEKISSDDDLEDALNLLFDVLTKAYPKMQNDSAALIWCDWRSEPHFRRIIEDAGFDIKNSIIWDKPNHGTGDLNGSFAPKHERLIFATKGRPTFYGKRLPDVLTGGEFLISTHPTPKPVDLIQSIIETLTLEKEVIADPFMGTAPTGVAAHRAGRLFWGCELSESWYGEAVQNIADAKK